MKELFNHRRMGMPVGIALVTLALTVAAVLLIAAAGAAHAIGMG